MVIKLKTSLWITLVLVLLAITGCGKSKDIKGFEEKLSDPDWQVRMKAVEELVEIGPEQDVIDALIGVLDDDNKLVRSMALAAFAQLGKPAGKALPAIVNAYNDEDSIVRLGAVIAIGCVGDSSEAVPLLIKALDDEDDTVRATAATSLGGFGSEAKPALDKLRSMAKNDPWKNPRTGEYMVREAAKEAIKKITGSE